MPSSSHKKLLQDKRCCSHSHCILTELAEIDPRSVEWLLESITLDEPAKLWENVLADLQTGPSTQDNELWVEKINEICDTCTKVVGCVFEYLGCSRVLMPGSINT